MHISELSFKRRALFNFLLFCIIVGGILSFNTISKLEDPEIVIMQSKVVTIYPGASAHEVEMQVTDILENEISALADLNLIKSQSAANVSIIDVELEMTVPQEEIEQRWEFLRRKISYAISKLPEGCQEPSVIDDFGDVYGMFYAMTGDGYSYKEMNDYADYVKREMLEIDGVSKVQIYGEQSPTVDITLSTEKMSEMGLFPMQVISAIQGQNKTVYSGALQTGNNKIKVNVSDKLTSIDDLRNLIIHGANGDQFHLSDIATVEHAYKTPLKNTMFLNNKKALGISISMESGENIVALGSKVEKKLEELKRDIPVGLEFDKVFFQPEKVSKSIGGFMINLIASVIIVALVLMITMGLRSGLIIGAGLVLTILATFPILLSTGGTLQRISLGAFIVAMGMLVDNAIVIIDGIIVDLQKGRRTKSTFTRTAKRTSMPLLGATIIAVAAFLPVFLSKDTAGTYTRDLFIVLCISLLLSWLLALTQVPLFAARYLKKKKKSEDPHTRKEYQIIKRVLHFFMQHKTATVVVSVILLAISGYSFKYVKQTFFPDFDYNQVYIEYKLPEGTCPDKVNRDLKSITEHFLSYKEVEMVVASQGMTPTRYSLVRAIGEMSDSYGELIVNFADYETMIKMRPVLAEYLHSNYPDAYTRIRKYNLSIKSSHTVEVEFSGPDPAILRDLSKQAREVMAANPYTDKYTIQDNWQPIGKALYAKYDQSAARRVGATRFDVSNAILAATDGLPIGYLHQGETKYAINLKTVNSNGSKIEDLNEMPVWNMIPNVFAVDKSTVEGIVNGSKTVEDAAKEIINPVPLSAVTKGVDIEWEESIVRRSNGKRTIQAECDPIDGYSPALVRGSIMDDIENIELPDGYSMKWMGEYDLQSTALYNIFRYLPIAIILIIITLILLFNDYKKPIIIILCIPMAIIGIVPGLIVTGMPFTFIAIIGSLGLMGMLIKNSIVLIDEIGKQIKEGAKRYDAVINATISRVRPVIMASFTTILGMLPLFTDPMYNSMAVAVISGLIVGTLITLVFVPILYALFFGISKQESVEHAR